LRIAVLVEFEKQAAMERDFAPSLGQPCGQCRRPCTQSDSEIGVDSVRATTGEIRQQIERIEAARAATGSVAESHKHQGHRKWMAQR
jgi:hypothetical protein